MLSYALMRLKEGYGTRPQTNDIVEFFAPEEKLLFEMRMILFFKKIFLILVS
jgi:hypothetical protein